MDPMTRQPRPGILARLLAVVVAAVILVGCARAVPPTPTPSAARTDWDAVAAAVVLVAAVDARGVTVCSGSGTLVDAAGTIVTNFHVVEPTATCAYDHLRVGLAASVRAAPRLDHIAEVHAYDAALDLAVLRITSTTGGAPASGPFPAVELGDSDTVGINDSLHVFGYPGIGGATVTSTQGEVSGFTTEAGIAGTAWIKTDASLAGGNSGGLAADDAGRMIGVPTRAGASDATATVDCRRVTDTNGDGVIDTADTCVPIGGFINSIRPVNLVRPLLARAAGAGPVPTSELRAAGHADDAAATPTVTAVSFAASADLSDRPIGEAASFRSGVDRICAFFSFTGMGGVTSWDAVWTRDGVPDETASLLGSSWTWGDAGDTWFCTGVADDEPLPDGGWELSLYFGGDEPAVTRSVFVGDGHETVDFVVRNDLPVEVCSLFVTPDFASSWEDDRLGGERLAPGGFVALALPAGRYQVVAQDCAGGAPTTREAVLRQGALIAVG